MFTFICVIHTNPWPRLWIRTWITRWLLWLNRIWPAFKQCNLGLSNADVQISSGESSSVSRAGNLVLELKAELKSWWARPALLDEDGIHARQGKSWGSPGRGGSSLCGLQSSWLQTMAFLSAVSGWRPACVPTMATAPEGLLIQETPSAEWGGKCSNLWTCEKETSQERVGQTYPKLVAL